MGRHKYPSFDRIRRSRSSSYLCIYAKIGGFYGDNHSVFISTETSSQTSESHEKSFPSHRFVPIMSLQINITNIVVKMQRRFRRKRFFIQRAAFRIQCLIRLIRSKKRARLMKLEKDSAIIIQCAYRCHLARICDMNLHSVDKMVVLHHSSAGKYVFHNTNDNDDLRSVPDHGPEKCLEHRDWTYWIADSKDVAEIRVEFESKQCITSIWIMTSTFASSPRYVSIGTVINKELKVYDTVLEKTLLPQYRVPRWHILHIASSVSKYFKVIFYDNYGDEKHIAVRQIRFVKSKEVSAAIVDEPEHVILEDGPIIGQILQKRLKVNATGWPLPKYQWYRNNRIIHGATNAEYILNLKCRLSSRQRTYRCFNCKMVTREAPFNAYRVKCNNCASEFIFKETFDFDMIMKNIKAEEQKAYTKHQSLLENRLQIKKHLETVPSVKYENMLKSVNDHIQRLVDRMHKLREERYVVKQRGDIVTNRFADEGIYTCRISNIRGGSILIERLTRRVVVAIERSSPFPLRVYPYYFPRQQGARKKWPSYASLLGTFTRGTVEGIVVIQYGDGSYYEGPYVSEEWLDKLGRVRPEGRVRNHYGVYKCSDGRIFEGKVVDNHFDEFNIQTFYKLTLPNGEVYEGVFCDEQFHGHGIYRFMDGSVYEGMWHRGQRFGHGHFRSCEGWTYEGYFDNNRRHGEGCITYPDGAMYIGDWYYDKIQGKGVMMTKLRDVYKGTLSDGKYHGRGELLYGDGSKYVGEFAGVRYLQ